MRLVHDLGRNGALFFGALSPLRGKRVREIQRLVRVTFGEKVSPEEAQRIAKANLGYQRLGMWDRRFPGSVTVDADQPEESEVQIVGPLTPFLPVVSREFEGHRVSVLAAPIHLEAVGMEGHAAIQSLLQGLELPLYWLSIQRSGISSIRFRPVRIEAKQDVISRKLNDFVSEYPEQYQWSAKVSDSTDSAD